ncbi:hypothetical protein R3X25_00290 [Lutibacter sp. TH_r2]|uniref:hypothetical protein n=1 Tax=Lutibacter sp. TH_r2 TaxID=3082083 RepID=UPI002954539A|nr:hypothetical protein [Lutibacter sp. TH_r2]MDV7185702.1 hypothetical protein [Lutibacter sp. TH_r2]
MKFNFKHIVFLISLIGLNSFAQLDSTSFKKINNEVSSKTSTNLLQAKKVTEKTSPTINVDLNNMNKIDEKKIATTISNSKPNIDPDFLMVKPPDKDIIGRKYWEGKDVTNKTLKSSVSMGTVYTKAKTVRVVCRDYSYVDGDIIKIYLNEKPLSTNISLKASSYMVYMHLVNGYNRVDFQAMNQGSSGPNTAELLLYDEHDNLIASKEWNLATGQIATIGVIQQD